MTINHDGTAGSCRLVGVGVGPGDPDLVTARAVNTLRSASRVFAPSGAVDVVGRAESIVRQVCPELRVNRLVFEMTGSQDHRDDVSRRAAIELVGALRPGATVAFVTLGDPNIYSTFSSLATAVRRLRPGTLIDTVPGITAFQDLAARAGTVLLDGAERLSLVTALDGAGTLGGELADAERAVVVYKGGRHLPAVAGALERANRLKGAVVGELLGLPGERVTGVADVGDVPASYLATVIVPPCSRAEAR